MLEEQGALERWNLRKEMRKKKKRKKKRSDISKRKGIM